VGVMENSIINAIENYESKATQGGELQDSRAKAMDYYLGRPFQNERDGRSQVVSRDVSDSIEWIKPGLLRIFTSGDDVVSFAPKGPEDIEQAQQETDYVNHIITEKNNWFNTAYVWFTDALLQKNGYVKTFWDERESVEKEHYKGLTDDQLKMISLDPEVDVIEDEAFQVMYKQQVQGPMGPMIIEVPVTLHNVTVQKNKKYGCAKYLPIAPERTLVSVLHDEVDLEHADFVEHWEYKTISDLRREGFEIPDDIGDNEGSSMSDLEEQARNRFNEDSQDDGETNDPSMKRVKARECWLRFDEDGDGMAELRHCMVVGHTVLLNEEADFIPIACVTPRMMPHRHMGISTADDSMDIQLIKSTLQRGFLDNLYFAINGEKAVDKNKVNLDDMMTSRPQGIKRVDGNPHDAIMQLTNSGDFGAVLQGIQYFDMVRQERTGSSKNAQQLSPDALAKMPSGIAIAQLQTAQQAIVELIARVFAETGVKSLFRMIHALTLKHSTQQDVVRLRNKWVAVNPREWKTRTDMTISVGLGTGNAEQRMMMLERIMGMQMNLIPLGLANPKTVRHTASKFTQAAGFKDVEAFWPDAEKIPPPQPPQPDPIKVGELKVKAFEAETHRMAAMKPGDNPQLEYKKEMDKAGIQRQTDLDKAAISRQTDLDKAAMVLSQKDRELKAKEDESDMSKESVIQVQLMKESADKITQATDVMTQAALSIAEAARMMAQAATSEEVLVRGKDGKAIGKKRVPAGTLN